MAPSGETLDIDSVTCVEGNPRQLRFADGQVIEVAGDTDWADHEVLVDGTPG